MLTEQKLLKRKQMVDYFRQVAREHNAKNQQIDFGDTLDKNDKKRVLVVLPESWGDLYMATSLFKSIRERYPRPEWSFYLATKPEYFSMFDGNPFLDKIISYIPQMDNLLWLEGQGNNKGYFNVAYLLHLLNQRILGSIHSGIDKLDLNLNN